MAVRRKTTKRKAAPGATARRRRKSTAAPMRRKTTRRRRGLSAASPAAIKSTIIDMLFAGAGAAAGMILTNQKFLDSQSETNKGLILGAVAIGVATIGKQPRLAAGMGAIAMLKVVQGLGAGKLIGLSESSGTYFPISEYNDIPIGLNESADYAGLNEMSVFTNGFGSNYSNI